MMLSFIRPSWPLFRTGPRTRRCRQSPRDGVHLYGPPRNLEEFRNPDGRYIVTFDGVIDGHLIQIAMLVTEDAANRVESLRAFARPSPVVKLFRDYMERNLRPDPVPDAIWALPATASSK